MAICLVASWRKPSISYLVTHKSDESTSSFITSGLEKSSVGKKVSNQVVSRHSSHNRIFLRPSGKLMRGGPIGMLFIYGAFLMHVVGHQVYQHIHFIGMRILHKDFKNSVIAEAVINFSERNGPVTMVP